MAKKRLVIRGGEVIGFEDEVSFKGLKLTAFEKKRVSHVVPALGVLRIMFNAIRSVTSDASWIAEWTRKWSCDWLVIVDGDAYGPFAQRNDAIRFEKDLIYGQGKLHLNTGKEACNF